MTLRHPLSLLGFAAACAWLVAPACKPPECSSDGDCSGRDVCEAGACEDGPQATFDEAAAGFCAQVRRCQPQSASPDCEEITEDYLQQVQDSTDPDCAAYADALANLYACVEDADCDAPTECVTDARVVSNKQDACDLG